MARIRSIKPEFWTDSNIVRLGPYARLLYIGMWNHACDRGHVEDDSFSLKLRVLPADNVDADELIEELIAAGRIKRVQNRDGSPYLHIIKMTDHQKVDARWNPRCPMCESVVDESASVPPRNSRESQGGTGSHAETPADSPQDRKGRDRIGKEGSSARAARGTRIPEDFTITASMRQWAQENAPEVNISRETTKFVNYWLSKTGQNAVKRDWERTWRNWIMQSDDYRTRDSPPSDVNPPGRRLFRPEEHD